VGKGTGLGLYISYGMAADLGGELSAANHPDGGALFTLRLPRRGGDHEQP
jgi:two-component system sensor histidine kinase HupT/HoxJ